MKLPFLFCAATVVVACAADDGGSAGEDQGGATTTSGGNLSLGGSSGAGRPSAGGAPSPQAGGAATSGAGAEAGRAPSGGAGGLAGGGNPGGQSASGGGAGGAAGGSSGAATTGGGSGAPGGAAGAGGVQPGSGGVNGGGGNGGATLVGGSGAGGQAAGSAGAGGDAGGYRACPVSPCKIMPFGDSITFGVGDEANGGYRGPLFASIVDAGKSITFTGSLSNGPDTVSGQTFPKRNEGHSGWGISQVTPYSGGNAGIATVIPTPGFGSGSGGVPDVILLHIGTNDASTFSAAQMTSDLSGLLDKIIDNAPEAYLVVAQIIPLGYGTNDVIEAYNLSIPELVEQRVNAGKHVAMVDMFTGFVPSTMLDPDNVHPNPAGYQFMADRWYSAIGSLLPD